MEKPTFDNDRLWRIFRSNPHHRIWKFLVLQIHTLIPIFGSYMHRYKIFNYSNPQRGILKFVATNNFLICGLLISYWVSKNKLHMVVGAEMHQVIRAHDPREVLGLGFVKCFIRFMQVWVCRWKFITGSGWVWVSSFYSNGSLQQLIAKPISH